MDRRSDRPDPNPREALTVAIALTTTQITREPVATQPELLAPAGDRDGLVAAVENGANAVYFGLQTHNARARAANFHLGASRASGSPGSWAARG